MIESPGVSKLKTRVWPALAAAVGNCGGTNFRRRRFAGNLLRRDLGSRDYLRIYHSLIFPNGVRKTTSPARNADLVRRLVHAGAIAPKRGMRVLEVGASAGVDALATCGVLSESGSVDVYDLGDLYTELLYDAQRGLVFDQDKNLLQVDLGVCFVSIHFAYNYRFQRWLQAPKRLLPLAFERLFAFDPRRPTSVIPLFHPDVRVDTPGSPFRSKRVDAFQPISGVYDLVVCMHLLVDRYFDRDTIAAGVRNLSTALAPGGTLVVGATERFDVVQRRSDGSLVTRSSRELFGGGRVG